MAIKRHKRHKYYKVDVAQHKVWACGLPDCTHYMPKHMENLINGKDSYCWECDAHITLNPSNMSENKPRCENCRLGIKPEIEVEAPISPALAAFLNGTK